MATADTLAPTIISNPLIRHAQNTDDDPYLTSMRLTSNGTPIAPSALGRLLTHTVDTPTEVLKAFYEEHGYLLIKKLLPVDIVREMRRK
jgi:hypothetical protein